jgi:phage portal protein BeeE
MSKLLNWLKGKPETAPTREADKGIHILPAVAREVYPAWNMKSGIEAYQENPWVYAAVRAIATEVARSTLRLYSVNKEESVEVADHPAMKLLAHPNEYQSFYELMEALQTWMELTGEAALYVNHLNNGTPAEIYILDPRYLSVLGDPVKYITGFTYRPNNGQAINMTPEEVILFKEYNPLNEYRGHAPILSARWSVEPRPSGWFRRAPQARSPRRTRSTPSTA